MSGAGPDALTQALDVDLGSVRANEHRPDFVPFRGCCLYDPGPRRSRVGALETEVLSLFEVPPDGGVHDPAGFELVPGVVPVAEVLGDLVRAATRLVPAQLDRAQDGGPRDPDRAHHRHVCRGDTHLTFAQQNP